MNLSAPYLANNHALLEDRLLFWKPFSESLKNPLLLEVISNKNCERLAPHLTLINIGCKFAC